ncbi:MAG TPA: methyl-accepting chemotaxis protein [Bryobacteraceae bacterium]|nr:methyl-accepting chemotaxis protein [Bryobacteraceae bacterium]
MKSQMTIGKRFVLTAGLLLALATVLGVGAFLSIRSLSRSVDTIVNDPLPGVYRISRVDSLIWQYRGDAWKYMGTSRADVKRDADNNRPKIKAQIDQFLKDYETTIATDEDRALFAKVRPLYQRYTELVEQQVLPLIRSGRSQQAEARYIQEAQPVQQELAQALAAEVDLNRKNSEVDAAAAQSTASQARWLIVVLLIAAMVSGSALVYFIVRSLNATLTRAASDLSSGAEQVASAAGQVSSSSSSLAQGSSEQAASLEETSAAAEEINSMALKNAENSRVAADLVAQSQQKFGETNAALEQMVRAMSEINSSSEKISKIIKVIDEIAFQTNILALNAAVEAARAGEAGMGFAVVADEVRNLAQRCSQAAKDTTALIEESIAKSNDGRVKVDHVAAGIREITSQSAQVKTLVDEVNIGSQEQARGMEQVAKAVTQMEQVTQSAAANAEESAAAAEELNAQSETLLDVVDQLGALVGGDHAESGRARRKSAVARRSGATHASGVKKTAPLAGKQAAKPQADAPAAAKDAFSMDEEFKAF